MSKQDESFRKSEKLIKVSKRESTENKPGSCAHCHYHRPEVSPVSVHQMSLRAEGQRVSQEAPQA